MSTQNFKLYMHQELAKEPRPEHPQSDYLDITNHLNIAFLTPWRDFAYGSTIYPFVMDYSENVGPFDGVVEEDEIEVAPLHYGWVKMWMSNAVLNDYTISAGATLSADLNFGCKYELPEIYAFFHFFTWRSDGTKGPTHFLGAGEQMPALPPTLITTSRLLNEEILTNPITLSTGDRLALEVMWRSPWTILQEWTFRYNTTLYTSSMEMSWEGDDGLLFTRHVGASWDIEYDVYEEFSDITDLYYSYLAKITQETDFKYNIRGQLYHTVLETDSSLRGHNSIHVRPEHGFMTASSDLFDLLGGDQFLHSRWSPNKATLNEYFMLDDFEWYISNDHMTASGYFIPDTSSLEDGTLSFILSLSEAHDFSSYSYLSILSKADSASVIRFTFLDTESNESFPTFIPINTKRGRYEAEVTFDGIDSTIVDRAKVTFVYAGDVYLDDLALIKESPTSEYVTWAPLYAEDVQYSRQSKINSILIPEGGGEVYQHMGDYNARGSLRVRTFDNRLAYFLKAKMEDGVPLFLRAKNTGFPVYIRNFSSKMENQSARGIQSELIINFEEVYDSEV